MLLDLSKHFEIQKARTQLEYLIEKKAKIDLTEKRNKRTVKQNAYLHAIFTVYAIEFGEHPEYVKQYIFKQMVNSDLFKGEFVNKKTGEIREMWLTTSKLNTKQMTLAIERFRNWSAQHGCYIMSSEEYIEQRFYFNQLVEQNKEYL